MKNFIVLFLILSCSAFATETKIVTITSDVDRDSTVFYLISNPDGSIDGMRFITTNVFGRVETDETHPVERVMAEGMVLFRQGNYEAVRLKLEKFNPMNGGDLKIDYLFSGVSNTRRALRLVLVKTDNGFTLRNAQATEVLRLRVLGNWNPILGLVGIREIVVNPSRFWLWDW
jgi:hypothetical protein